MQSDTSMKKEMMKKNWFESVERYVPIASHIAQVLTTILTAGGLFFTVIPLYQKAAVDEQVAKQQHELVKLEQRVESSYRKIRRDAIHRYVFNAGAQCTGLMVPVLPATASAPAPDLTEQTLAIDVTQCLQEQRLSVAELEELRPADRAALDEAINRAARTIEDARVRARFQVSQINPAHDPVGPVELGTLVMPQIALLKKAGASEQEIRQVVRSLAANEARLKIDREYGDIARKQINALDHIAWPPVTPAD
ncbi:hypothetical protein [Burkholderia gladioli]|uniref:hypothetical protein n=1 Tax=Burkholderia gladioli TaxID=28095 RepID=UPI00163FB124|nr:hypothetical protein [Burkholderia gladioli]